jgi:hypothetical protein
MPVEEIAPIQNELWRLVAHAQQCGLVGMSAGAREQWTAVYSELSREHSGLAGSIINRAEAQTMRLALIYALLDGRNVIQEKHLNAALALWRYAQDSALYIFGDRAADPLEEKILEALKQGPLTATELSSIMCRNIPKERLQPILQQMEARQRISISHIKQKGRGRPRLILSLHEINVGNEKNENNELNERNAVAS